MNSLTSGLGFFIGSSSLTTGRLIYLSQTNAGFTGTIGVLHIANQGAGKSFFIDQNGDGIAIDIDSEATTADVINIDGATTTGIGVDINFKRSHIWSRHDDKLYFCLHK